MLLPSLGPLPLALLCSWEFFGEQVTGCCFQAGHGNKELGTKAQSQEKGRG